MKCPRCAVEFHDAWEQIGHARDRYVILTLHSTTCPACYNLILRADRHDPDVGGKISEVMLYPRGALRPVAPEVPDSLSSLYREATLTLGDSPRASAALSRRCVQELLVDHAGATGGELYAQIEWALQNAGLPSHLQESLHAVRAIGNIAAHTQKSTVTGDVVDVAPGEAEWNLDTLDGLFDFYFVQPARTAARRAALDAKQAEIGKPPLP